MLESSGYNVDEKVTFWYTLPMTHYVGIKELRQNMDKYAQHAQRGDEIIVMKHNKPLFKLCHPESNQPLSTDQYLALLAKTRGSWAGDKEDEHERNRHAFELKAAKRRKNEKW